ncbi:MAG: hypothetical protein QM784_02530 [Polyangiaceae bacterium]
MANDECRYLSAILLCIGLGSLSSGCDGCGKAGRAARASVACSKACQSGFAVAPEDPVHNCREACLARLNGSGPTCALALVKWVECVAAVAKASQSDARLQPPGAVGVGTGTAQELAHCAQLEAEARQCEGGCRAEGRLDVGNVVVQGREHQRDVLFELLDCGCTPCRSTTGAEPMSVCKSAKVCRPLPVSCDGGARQKLLRACIDGRCATTIDASALPSDVVFGATCTVEPIPTSR